VPVALCKLWLTCSPRSHLARPFTTMLSPHSLSPTHILSILIFSSADTGARGVRNLLHRRDHRPTKPRRLQPERVNRRWRSYGSEHRREVRRWLGEQQRYDAESQARRSGSAGTIDLLWSGPRPSTGRKASGRQIKTHITWHGMLYLHGGANRGEARRCRMSEVPRHLILVEWRVKGSSNFEHWDTPDHGISHEPAT